MHKIWVVIRREFIEKVRNKWFVVSTVLGPILMAAFIVVPIVLAEKGGRRRTVAVVDVTTSDFGRRVTDMLNGPAPIDAVRLIVALDDLEETADSLAKAVGDKTLDGFLILTDEAVEDGRAEYRGCVGRQSIPDRRGVSDARSGREPGPGRGGDESPDRQCLAGVGG